MDKKGQNPRKNSKELGVVLVKPKRPDIGSRLSRKFSGNTSFTSERKSSLNKTQRPEVRKNSNQSEFKFEIIEPSHYQRQMLPLFSFTCCRAWALHVRLTRIMGTSVSYGKMALIQIVGNIS